MTLLPFGFILLFRYMPCPSTHAVFPAAASYPAVAAHIQTPLWATCFGSVRTLQLYRPCWRKESDRHLDFRLASSRVNFTATAPSARTFSTAVTEF